MLEMQDTLLEKTDKYNKQNIWYCSETWVFKQRVGCVLPQFVLQSEQPMSKVFYQAHLTKVNTANPWRRYRFLDFAYENLK